MNLVVTVENLEWEWHVEKRAKKKNHSKQNKEKKPVAWEDSDQFCVKINDRLHSLVWIMFWVFPDVKKPAEVSSCWKAKQGEKKEETWMDQWFWSARERSIVAARYQCPMDSWSPSNRTAQSESKWQRRIQWENADWDKKNGHMLLKSLRWLRGANREWGGRTHAMFLIETNLIFQLLLWRGTWSGWRRAEAIFVSWSSWCNDKRRTGTYFFEKLTEVANWKCLQSIRELTMTLRKWRDTWARQDITWW